MGENIKKNIGEKLKKIREQRGLTRRELAEKVGVSETHVYNMEGGRGGYSLNSLSKFAQALNCEIQTFYANGTINDKIEKYNEKVNELDMTTKSLINALCKEWDNEKVVLVINYLIKKLINKECKHEK